MKKKLVTFVLLAVIVVSFILPVAVQAAESWNRGYNKKSMQWYNNYLHSSCLHYGTIYKNGVTYKGPTASAGYWSKINLDFNGPYAVTYNKYVIR